jgi:hypothetical protein
VSEIVTIFGFTVDVWVFVADVVLDVFGFRVRERVLAAEVLVEVFVLVRWPAARLADRAATTTCVAERVACRCRAAFLLCRGPVEALTVCACVLATRAVDVATVEVPVFPGARLA